MNERIENIIVGADYHAGDGGYRIGSQEDYEKFVERRNLITREKAEADMGIIAKPGKVGMRTPTWTINVGPSAWRKTMKYWAVLWLGFIIGSISAGVMAVVFSYFV
jgi:hypothetical protein